MLLDLGSATYGAAALFLFFLLVAQVRIWSGGVSSFVLLSAIFATTVWAGILTFQPRIPLELFYVVPILEIIKNSFWFALLLSILGARKIFFSRFRDGESTSDLVLITAVSLLIPGALFLYVVYLQFVENQIFFYPRFGGRIVLAGFLLMAITGLALLEQMIRNIRFHHVWHLKFLCLSLGVLFSYDIFLFSNALLFDRVQDQLWDARGAIVALATPLIAVSVIRTRQQPMQVNISRRLVFHSGVLIVAGVYLLLMALAGFYIRDFSGQWGLTLQVVFWVVSLSLLVMLVYSGRMRSTLKQYINRHLFSSKYDYREEWMRFSNTLSRTSIDDSLPERVIHALADIVDSPSGALWLSTNGTHFDQLSHVEMGWVENSSISSSSPLVKILSGEDSLIDLTDLPDYIDPNAVPDWLREVNKAWLIIPLRLEAKLLGFVLLKESRVESELNWEDYELMNAAGQQAASYLAQMMASDALSEVRQFSAFNQVSAFVVHDIKTLNSQLSLLVANAEKHKTNPSFIEDMIKTTEHAVGKMSHLLQHFNNGSEGDDAGDKDVLELVGLINSLLNSHTVMKPVPQFVGGQQQVEVLANEAELKASIGHLVNNAQEATADTGSVIVEVTTLDDDALIYIKDNGCGMTQEFINLRLFKPFESTKGLTGMGVGVFQSRSLIRQLGGDLLVKSEIGKGSQFTIRLPLHSKKTFD